MYQVTQKVFEEYVIKNNLIPTQGEFFHSTNYVDTNGQVKARYSTSSWNPNTVYEISDDRYANLQTVETIKNFLR